MKSKQLFWLVFWLALFIICFFLLFFASKIFLIKKVILISSQEIKGLSALNGKNLLWVEKTGALNYIKKNNFFIKKINFQKIYPHTLILFFEERKPVAYLKTPLGKLAIDEIGVPVLKEAEDLPIIEVSSSQIWWLSPKKVDWRIKKALEILRLFGSENPVRKILVDDIENVFRTELVSFEEIVIPYKASINEIAPSLQVIIHRFRIEGKKLLSVDFRFEKPIVKLIGE